MGAALPGSACLPAYAGGHTNLDPGADGHIGTVELDSGAADGDGGAADRYTRTLTPDHTGSERNVTHVPIE